MQATRQGGQDHERKWVSASNPASLVETSKRVYGSLCYLVVTVAGGLERPYYLKKYGMTPNGCYTRIGTQASPMTQNMIDGFFSRRILNTLHNVVSPNHELTFTQLKIYYQEKGYDAAGSYFLKNLDLFTEDGKYNYAAYLMADHNGTSIKVARFRGTE